MTKKELQRELDRLLVMMELGSDDDGQLYDFIPVVLESGFTLHVVELTRAEK
jgi:hypothetical protein